ncbi:alkyl sulfatase dimerization domain-containing protein [Rhizobium sp. BK313]|uniref:alkyl sulfatase dimerization domain-containing protein n=1 Tax=Rhizobium sp. BK313 TaxID=2587081 RepID=UPI00248489DC|nr:alkyl sulfatase dimerization domain-containing protein [Rhizobium sp. BK313]
MVRRGYHGSYLHNSRAVIQRYLGFGDLNPATLVPLSPERVCTALRGNDGRRLQR